MVKYEVTMLFNPNEKDSKKIAEAILKEAKVNIKKTIAWGEKELAQEIKKLSKANYWHFQVEAEPQAIKELQNKIRLSEKILRDLIIKID
jgi:small subunit ribosomal protein S6